MDTMTVRRQPNQFESSYSNGRSPRMLQNLFPSEDLNARSDTKPDIIKLDCKIIVLKRENQEFERFLLLMINDVIDPKSAVVNIFRAS